MCQICQKWAGKAPAEERPNLASPSPNVRRDKISRSGEPLTLMSPSLLSKYGGYVHQSEGFPRTGYFIPAHVGTGAGPDLSSFRRRRPAYFLANLAHVWQSTFFSRLGTRKEISARHYREIARNYVARLFLRSANSKTSFC